LRQLSAAIGLALSLATSAPVLAENGWTSFGEGKAEVKLPPEYNARSERHGALVAVFGPNRSHRLELTLIDYDHSPGPPDLAERFVRAIGERQKRKVARVGGKTVLFEPAGDYQAGGVTYRVARWQIGFARSLVVMTLITPLEAEMPPALRDFVDRRYGEVLASLRRTSR
jgi:hypothetical protein